ncbi:ECF transporter S component [Pseudoflavonifractor sp. 60]|uniref:ECF transporter S component n=1 Tax=Pseudoflavonifractor sp. 60 TaxID=2304576 RepID=UPI00136A1DAD|nr:ECF transporter S component [Pseudoflavonifractor sp. 60]NBI68732.1 ECF transporter S component [Pseudoflavonifractor sp. 60]
MKTRKHDTRWLVGVALFVALQLVLQMTGIGLIPLPFIKATTLHIPVIIGAVVLGPLAGGILGGVFGICSIWTNTVTPSALSFAFSPVLAAETSGASGAVKAVWIALGCRILIGVVSGWLWIGLKKLKVNDFAALPIVGVAGALTNTVLVMGSIYVLLRPEYAALKNVAMEAVLGLIMGVVGTSGVAEAVAAAILVTAIGKALLHVPALRPQANANI